MSVSPILEDDSVLSAVDRTWFRFESALAVMSGLAIFSLMLLAVGSVGGRQAFGQPLAGYVDWIEQLMPLIALVAMSYNQRLGAHIRMDLVVSRLRGRALWAAELVATLVALALVVALLWGSTQHFLRSFDWNSPLWSRDSSMDVGLPLWPAKACAPLGFAGLAVRLGLQAVAYGLAIGRGSPSPPVAVPLIQDAASVAAKEASALRQAGGAP